MICGTVRVYEKGAENEEPTDNALVKEYGKRYGEIVDIANRKLEKWNAYWAKLSGGPDLEENSLMWDVYGQVISAFERHVCAMNNLKYPGSRIQMDVYSDKGDPMIIGIIDREYDHHFYLNDWKWEKGELRNGL